MKAFVEELKTSSTETSSPLSKIQGFQPTVPRRFLYKSVAAAVVLAVAIALVLIVSNEPTTENKDTPSAAIVTDKNTDRGGTSTQGPEEEDKGSTSPPDDDSNGPGPGSDPTPVGNGVGRRSEEPKKDAPKTIVEKDAGKQHEKPKKDPEYNPPEGGPTIPRSTEVSIGDKGEGEKQQEQAPEPDAGGESNNPIEPAPDSLAPIPAPPETQPPSKPEKVEPEYPEKAKFQEKEGEVILEIRVSKEGIVVDPVVVLQSTDPIFEKAAIEAVRQWKYSPAMKGGIPVPYVLRVPIKFVWTQ
jgi:protein TonB